MKRQGCVIFAVFMLLTASSTPTLAQYVPFRAWDDKALSWNVLRWGYGQMLEDHIRRVAFEANLHRAWPKTPQAIREKQRALRAQLWHIFGLDQLKKVPLQARITGEVDRGNFVIQKLIYRSLPGVYVTGNVYVPKDGQQKHPAVFCPHGHWPQGRFQPAVQARAVGLVNLGYVVLTIDKYGYGERRFTGHWDAFYLLPSGLTLEGLQIWDNMRGIDYLLSRSDVDPSRIGITGASGGGNQTMYTAALDTRIAAAVPTASVNTFDGLFFRGIGCVCEGTPNILRFADEWDVLACIAPRALLIPSNVLDPIFPVAKTREAYFRTRDVYAALNARDRIAIRHFYDKHSYNREVREVMYGWFEHVFRHKKFEAVPERPEWLPTEDFSELRVLEDGKFPEDAKTLTDIAIAFGRRFEHPQKFAAKRELESYRKKVLPFLRDQVFGGFPEEPGEVRVQVIDTTNYRGWRMEKWLIWSDWDILLPAVFVHAEKPVGTVVLANSAGKSRAFVDNWVLEAHNRDFNVLAVDLRGVGETAEKTRLLVQNGLVAGKPVLGEWVWDYRRCVDALQRQNVQPETPVFLVGDGPLGLSAALTPLFDRRVRGVATLGTLGTYIARDRYDVDWVYYLHGILKEADIPQLLALAAPARLVLAGAIWPSGEPVTSEEARQLFQPVASAYKLLGQTKQFVLLHKTGIRASLKALLPQ